ncbi:trehalose-6-phosphate synthase [Haloechinothrix sp. YIM 98757]|uniref:Trehalose-6-phosphate synthase n=1 Tax=Haloechinothrix aidingensis TaxID=2752311 RepID=A0A838A5T5_9PSEU|nr:trehalose-6-phosphate synthase [Haloechinothrix aidingensis]MBA0125140.1 trehalose-6-phosphate synthase [Haloechinothrix aidingensis]
MSSEAARVLIASNRGPVSFTTEDGEPAARRGGGGLVSALSGVELGDAGHVVWVCAALGETDRQVAARAPGGRIDRAGHQVGDVGVRMLDVPPATLEAAYNSVANSTLWFLHHLLFDTPRAPRFDAGWREMWDRYREYNRAFAGAVADEAAHGAKVAVQDYHLSLVPRMLRERRPDLRIAHFTHTPWAPPEYFRMLPDDTARELLRGILGADHAGFLSPRWARAFADCCAGLPDARTRDPSAGPAAGPAAGAPAGVEHAGRVTTLGVHGLGVDGAAQRERSRAADVDADYAELADRVGGRQLVLRVDRTELSKNILGGLAAYRELLRSYPRWRGEVVHLAFAYPSRQDLAAYREYTADVHALAREIVEEFGTEDWCPVLLETDVSFARSLAAYRLADVLLVNPVRDGMNLVAKEVPVCSERDCVLVLSREAGAADDLGADALLVNPFDTGETAESLHRALLMPSGERAGRAKGLAEAATAMPPRRWLAQQLDALDSPRAG